MATEGLYTYGTLRTCTGVFVNLAEPDAKDIQPIDIATHLSRVCRFAGATQHYYSVAEHSLWCALKAAQMYPKEYRLQLATLLHDGHEYLLGDLASPAKARTQGYKQMAAVLQNAIEIRFRCWVSRYDRDIIKEIDRMALEWEWENKVINWTGSELPPSVSAQMFLAHLVKLCKHQDHPVEL